MKKKSELIDDPENISLLRGKIKLKEILSAIYKERYKILIPHPQFSNLHSDQILHGENFDK